MKKSFGFFGFGTGKKNLYLGFAFLLIVGLLSLLVFSGASEGFSGDGAVALAPTAPGTGTVTLGALSAAPAPGTFALGTADAVKIAVPTAPAAVTGTFALGTADAVKIAVSTAPAAVTASTTAVKTAPAGSAGTTIGGSSTQKGFCDGGQGGSDCKQRKVNKK